MLSNPTNPRSPLDLQAVETLVITLRWLRPVDGPDFDERHDRWVDHYQQIAQWVYPDDVEQQRVFCREVHQ